MQYAQDNDETMPGISFGGPAPNRPNTVWPGTLNWQGVFTAGIGPYLKSVQVLQCPSDAGTGRWDGANGISYGYSEHLYNYDYGWCKLAALANARPGVTGVVIVCDTFASGIVNDWDTGNGESTGMARIKYGDNAAWTSRHSGTNCLYADGHVKIITEKAIMNTALWGNNQLQNPVLRPNCYGP